MAPGARGPRISFRDFLKTGNVKFALVAGAVSFPVLGLFILNDRLVAYSRPYVIQAREWILGRPDDFNRRLDAALSGRPVPSSSTTTASRPRAAGPPNIFDALRGPEAVELRRQAALEQGREGGEKGRQSP